MGKNKNLGKARIQKLIETFKLSNEKAVELDKLLTQVVECELSETEDLFQKVNDYINGNGIEKIDYTNGWVSHYWQECKYLYVNMGDTYDQTIVYDTENNKIIIGDWGSLVERHMKKFS